MIRCPFRPRSHRTHFFAVRGAFFELYSVGSERSARYLCAPGALRFCRLLRLAFLQEHSAPEVEKKATLSGQAPHVIVFFFPLSNRMNGEAGLPLW